MLFFLLMNLFWSKLQSNENIGNQLKNLFLKLMIKDTDDWATETAKWMIQMETSLWKGTVTGINRNSSLDFTDNVLLTETA